MEDFRERDLMASLEHRCLVKYQCSFVHDNTWLCIVMNYYHYGDLGDIIEHCKLKGQSGLKESVVLSFIIQVRGA